MDGILFIYFTLPLLALFLCLIARIINKLCLKKRRILAEYDKKGRELMKQRIVTDRALIQAYGISEGHTVAYYGVAIQIHEVIADNNMVRDEVVIQRGGEPRSHDGYYDGKLGAAREPEQFCPGCTGCGCGYIDYGSTEVTYVNNREVACCCECCCTGIYRSEFGDDRAKTSDIKYVAVEYLDKHGMKEDLSVRKVVQLINEDKLQHAAITMAHNYAQQKNVATSENINVEMGPDSDMKPLVNSQVLPYESNTNLGTAQPRVCINCGAARTTDGQFCSHCGTRF
jgi:hypothetical protein